MNQNDRLQRVLVGKLTMARHRPPTITRLLLHWSSLPGLTLVGVVGVAALVALGIPSPVPMLVVGIFLGAALRDAGIARRTVRFWPIQQELFDWPKIEALAQGMADVPGECTASPQIPPAR
jgi:hypothetical protein